MALLPFGLFERAQEQGSRSTVLRPLGWVVVLCAAAAIASLSVPHPIQWLTVLFGAGFGISVLLYLLAFCYCLIKMPEALRTERYSIQKLAIEKGFKGDSSTGVISHEPSVRMISKAENESLNEQQ
jgi:hypothetical protein